MKTNVKIGTCGFRANKTEYAEFLSTVEVQHTFYQPPQIKTLEKWRAEVPDIAIRSSFVVGFPGETEEDFDYLLNWLEEAQLDRVGAFRFEPVEGAAANALPDPVPDALKEERFARVMELTARISAEKLAARVGQTIDVLIDRVDEVLPEDRDGRDFGHLDAPHPEHHPGIGATGRSKADAPEIDGEVHLRDAGHLRPGDFVRVRIEDSDEHDLFGVAVR